MNFHAFLFFSIFLCYLSITTVYAELSEEEQKQLKLQIVANHSVPQEVWKVVQAMASRLRISEFVFGQNLSALYLLEYDIGLQWLLKENPPKPSQIGTSFKPNFLSPVSLIQLRYITHLTGQIKGEFLEGEFTFESPNVYKGTFPYKAEKREGKWKIIEYYIPNRGSFLRLEKLKATSEDGYILWYPDANGEIWILREIDLMFNESINAFRVFRNLKATDVQEEMFPFEELPSFIQKNNATDKIFLRISDLNIPFKKMHQLFQVFKEQHLDFMQHVEFDSRKSMIYCLTQELWNQFNSPAQYEQFSAMLELQERTLRLFVHGKKEFESPLSEIQPKDFQEILAQLKKQSIMKVLLKLHTESRCQEGSYLYEYLVLPEKNIKFQIELF